MAQSVTAQLDEVIAEASTDKAWEHMEWMSREVPTRISGWEPAKRHADYLTDELTSYGFAAHQDVFPGLVAYPRPGKLIITSPVEQVIEGYTFAHSISTPPEGLEGELLYVGAGGEADYEGKDARGKIVLAEFGYGGVLLPSFPKFVIDGTKPSRAAWLLKEKLLPPVYWKGMLRGKEWMVKPEKITAKAS